MSLGEVMDIKAYVKYYLHNMIFFFTIVLKELTDVDINNKKAGAHSLECNVSHAKLKGLICHFLP